MTNIYDQHRAAFANVAAYVIAKNGERVATIAFKYPRDGAGRLYAYAHWFGTEMVRGHANGYGYDKGSAAVSVAAQKMETAYYQPGIQNPAQISFMKELRKDDGMYWYDRLRNAGFDVWQAV